jgi:SAM-dependent methyltransferase
MSAAPAAERIPADRLALIARTLQIAPDIWPVVLADFEARRPPAPADETADAEIDRSLAALAPAYRARSPHEAPAPAAAGPRACPACARVAVRPAVVRRSPPPARDLVYGRCDGCGHGALLDAAGEAALRARYADPDYYRARDGQGAGYDGYDRDVAYRESKGARLFERLGESVTLPKPTVLEVGSGFGFTRAAVERAGVRTWGVDISAHAVAEAARRYGLDTFHGTLGEALASGATVRPGAFGLVLYQFVLEHVGDPVAELGHAREATAPGGWVVLLVPSMEAVEIDVFGGSYRSFRADHLHLFSRASLRAVLDRAGLALHQAESHCNVHLLGGLLSARALDRLYASGRGPDLFVLARRPR